LEAYSWPGNVRELANVLERAVIVANTDRVLAADLPETVQASVIRRKMKSEGRPTLAELETEYINETLIATRGNKSEAARLLGISRKNLYEKLARYEKARMKDEG